MNAKIAVPVENGEVFQHYGKAKQFKIYTIDDDKVTESATAEAEGGGHEAVAFWLVMRGVNAVICGNIGPGSLGALAGAGIVALAGVEGDADEAIAKFIAGDLAPASAPNCDHHGHEGGCGGGCHSGDCHSGGCGGGCRSGGCHCH